MNQVKLNELIHVEELNEPKNEIIKMRNKIFELLKNIILFFCEI